MTSAQPSNTVRIESNSFPYVPGPGDTYASSGSNRSHKMGH